MRFSFNKSYKVTALGEHGEFIASTYDSFDSKAAVIYWANKAAEREHKTLHRIHVSFDDGTYSDYTPSGRRT